MLDPLTTDETSGAAIFSRMLDSDREGMTAELAYHILRMRFSAVDKARMQELATKNQRGDISPQELEELDNYITAGDILAIWQSKARQALTQCQAPSARHG
jgi:Fic family protein